MATPGIGDPYWYEWFVGLKYVIKMLNPESGIDCVIFQSNNHKTIDDVVVEFNDGSTQLCFQVKHQIVTSNPISLTFAQIIDKSKNKNCLFKDLFLGWKAATTEMSTTTTKVILYTNKRSSNRNNTRKFNGKTYKETPLKKFLEQINLKFIGCNDLIEFSNDENDLSLQWDEFLASLGEIDITEIIEFLKHFSIDTNQPELSDLKQSLIFDLSKAFSCSEGIAQELLGKLLIGLSDWTTASRKNERVRIEDVYSVIGLEEHLDDSQHRLIPPQPFFESRQIFCKELESKIRGTKKNIIFISGEPGSGKTSIVSYLQSISNIFMFRYHTFRPISPEQRFYNDDPGMYTIESLWGMLLIQLRKKFMGKLANYNIPVNNKLVNNNDLRSHVIRLLKVLGEEALLRNERIFICIDGIDHAARANNKVTFLSSLPLPDEIPAGVCFTIVGQPAPVYIDQYPLWLSRSDDVEHVSIPKLEIEDIEQLVLSRANQFKNTVVGLAKLIYDKTNGNNLSAVFAVEQIKVLSSLEEAIANINNSSISDNIQQYYSHIWSHMKNELASTAPSMIFPESIVACPLLLMNGRVSVRILARALPYQLNENDWKMLLNRLYPLVIPTDNTDEYSLFHNDFRIFLMGIISTYNERYKEIALYLANDLIENEQGSLPYISAIPLLICSEKANLIPQYFTTEFVINALAEGVSKKRLDEYAHLSYDAACNNQDLKQYESTYLAIKTMHQHERYIDYYSRNYISDDFPEISSIDISEVRKLSPTKDNLDEFHKVLDLCVKLYSSNYTDCHSRAIRLYELWFENISPLTFIPLCDESITNDDEWQEEYTSTYSLLKHWGETAAHLKVSLPEINKDLSKLDKFVIINFGNQYFEYCIDYGNYDLAHDALLKGYVSMDFFIENLTNIYYANQSCKFYDFLIKSAEKITKPSLYLLTYAMKVTCNKEFLIDRKIFEKLEPVKHIYDDSVYAITIKVFLLGHLNRMSDDNALIKIVSKCCDQLKKKDNIREIQQIYSLAKFSCLLGKYFFYDSHQSSLFKESIQWFLNVKLYRSHDYSSVRKFLLFTLLKSSVSINMNKEDWFIDSLRTNLFEIEGIGMYYKTYILDFLWNCNRLDIIEDYIDNLYGKNCSRMNLVEDKLDAHERFGFYGELVDQKLMNTFSSQLKWDIVGYVGHKEYAMYGPYNCFKSIVEFEPTAWKKYGLRLYYQSEIANLSSNRACFDINKNIVKAAALSGLCDYWQLHIENEEFRLNPSLIYEAIFGFIEIAKDVTELESIWLLSCGIHSWYTKEGHDGVKKVYDVCCEKSTVLGFDFTSFVNEVTPSWLSIIQHYNEKLNYISQNNEYTEKKKEEIQQIIEEYNCISIEDLLYSLPAVKFLSNVNERFSLILNRVLLEDNNQHENLQLVLIEFCNYIKGNDWQYKSCENFIKELFKVLNEDAFWKLASTIKDHLSDYDYQISTRNMNVLLKLFYSNKPEALKSLFESEISTQELWVTGNGHIYVGCEQKVVRNKFSSPKTFSELGLYLLLEQIESQNGRKIESAIHAIYLLGLKSKDVMNTIPSIWNKISLIQKEFLLLVIARWANERLCSKVLYEMVIREYETCNELSYIFILHSILVAQDKKCIDKDKIDCSAAAVFYSIPENVTSKKFSHYENFFRIVEVKGVNSKFINNIRSITMNTEFKPEFGEDKYGEMGDSKIPVYNQMIDAVLYGGEQSGQWNTTPLISKKSSLICPEDPFVLTEMPIITFDSKWFPIILEPYESKKENHLTVEVLSHITNHNIQTGFITLAACLWHPWGHKEGSIYIESSKVNSGFNFDYNFEKSLGNFGLLAKEGAIIETANSTIMSGGASLFNRIEGTFKFYFGNCQLAPSSVWNQKFRCKPSEKTPYIWEDENGIEVLRFEKIASPYREMTRELYVRQPILFRWICNEEWLKKMLNDYGLNIKKYSIIEDYPNMN